MADSPLSSPAPSASRRARRVLKALSLIVVAPALVGVLFILLLSTTPWGNERIRRLLVSQANQRLTGTIAVGTLRGNLLFGGAFTNVELRDSSRRLVFSARRVEVRYALLSALRRQVVLHSLVLDTPVVVLDKFPGGLWNFQSLLRPGTTQRDTTRRSMPPELNHITIRHGRLLYRGPWQPDSLLPADKRDEAIAVALAVSARTRIVRVLGGYQRVMDFRNIDARLPSVRIAQGGQPAVVQIGALAMIAEPYRPPVIDVRSLTGTLYASKDSLWWHGARVALPGSNVRGDGKIGFRRSGVTLDLTAAPIAVADLRWLDPKLSGGGGTLRYRMRLIGDTAEYSISDADLTYEGASLAGNAVVARVQESNRPVELFVHGVDLTVAHLSTSTMQQLAPSLTLRRSGMLDGHIIVSGTSSAMQMNADIRFADARAGSSHVIARGGVGFAGGMRARNLSVRLLPLQVATLGGSRLKIPLGGVLSGSAVVSGTRLEGWTMRGDLIHVDRDARSRVIGSGRYQTAGKRIVADATLQPLSLATVGRFAPSAQLHGTIVGNVHVEGTTRDLRFIGVLHSQDGGTIDGRGLVTLAGSRTRYDVAVTLGALNASALSHRAPVTHLTGTLAARGSGISPATANAAITADLSHSRYDTFTVEHLHARATASNGLLRVDTLDVAERGVHASAAGAIGLVDHQRGTLRFAATVDSVGALRRWIGTRDTGLVEAPERQQDIRLDRARADSARRAQIVRIEQLALGLPPGVNLIIDTLPAVRRDSLAGSLSASGELSGNLRALTGQANVRGEGLVIRGNTARRVSARIITSNVQRRDGFIELEADSIQLARYGFERIAGSAKLRNGLPEMARAQVRQDSLVSFAVQGGYTRPATGAHVIRLDSLRARFDTLEWVLAHPAAVRLTNGSITVDSIDLRGSTGGRLYANGVVPNMGAVRLDIVAERVRIATVLQALQQRASADGVLGVSGRITGTRADPVIVGRAMLRDASYKGARVPDADADIAYGSKSLSLDATARDSTGHRVLIGAAVLPVDLSLTSVAGPRRLEAPLTADLQLDSFQLDALPIRLRELEELRGRVIADAHVRGSWRAPLYNGHATLRDGALRLSSNSTGMRLDNAVADLRLVGDSLFLDSLTARAKGTLRAFGTVDLKDRAHPFVRLSASGRDLRVFDSPRGLVDADGEIAAIGPLDALRVTGRGETKGGYLALKQFRKDLLRVDAPGDLAFFTVFDTAANVNDGLRVKFARAQPRRVAVIADLSLVVDRGNYYRNRPDANTEYYTGAGEEVRVHLDQRSSEQWAVGFVNIGDGVAFFRTRAFVPARGSLSFIPHTNAPGLVQQVGERIVWEPGRGLFPLQLLTAGTSKGPSVGLESGTLFPIRGRELNGYLTLGRLSTSLLQQSGSSLSGGSGWSGQLSGETGALARRQQGATALGVVLHDIGTGATKEFGLDAFSVSPADVPTELVFGKTGGVRGALIEGGRYLTTDRYVAGQIRPFTAGIPGVRVGQKFGTLYRLDIGVEPRFLFRAPAELGITHPTVRTGAFGAFLTRLWDF